MMPVHRHRDSQTLNWASNPVYASKDDRAAAKRARLTISHRCPRIPSPDTQAFETKR